MPKQTKKRATKRQPKTTRPIADERRELLPALSAADVIGRKLDAVPDRVDIRDWFYQPRLTALPDHVVNCDRVPEILDQGKEGACTGFALAACINFLLQSRGQGNRVSPRMLYEMARRYDEWPGEEYEGSSARGAMKGWVAHGVCTEKKWPKDKHGPENFTMEIADNARNVPGGAFYRIKPRDIRDIHAALHEVGIVYVTLMVHSGWNDPGTKSSVVSYLNPHGIISKRKFPVIQRVGRADGGHAVAFVGYTREGFIVQNSWGPDWGASGYALLPYEDHLLHAVDVWVAQVGVPLTIDLELESDDPDAHRGIQRAATAVPLSLIRPYAVDIGNNGELSKSGNYWTTEADLQRLFAEYIPAQTAKWSKRRVMLYLHGGLNSEATVARRIVSFRDIFLKNEIYPLHIMWETGAMETLNGIIADLFTDVDERAGGVGDWLQKTREGLLEARDKTFEMTTAKLGMALWDEMKENGRIASAHAKGIGGMQLLVKYAKLAMAAKGTNKSDWELHIVAHSAGSIFAAYAMPHLLEFGVPVKTLQFMAPAITVDLFKQTLLQPIKDGQCPHPTNYILSDAGERDDNVGPAYGKSLLFLVSNAFERRGGGGSIPFGSGVPLLGMERFVSDAGESGARFTDSELNALFKKPAGGLPSLVVAGRPEMQEGRKWGNVSTSNTHGGFDNDPATLNSVLHRILGKDPDLEFQVRDLQYGEVRPAEPRTAALMPGVPLRRVASASK